MKTLNRLSFVVSLIILVLSVTGCPTPEGEEPGEGPTACSSSSPALDCDAACFRDDGSIDHDVSCRQAEDHCACVPINPDRQTTQGPLLRIPTGTLIW